MQGRACEPVEGLLTQASSLAMVYCHMAKHSIQMSQRKSSRSYYGFTKPVPNLLWKTVYFIRKARFWSTCVKEHELFRMLWDIST